MPNAPGPPSVAEHVGGGVQCRDGSRHTGVARRLHQHLDQLGYDEAWIGEHHSAGSEIIASPVSSAFVADRSPEHTRGRYQASLGVMFALGAVVGPTIGTLTYEFSPDVLWIGCGVAGVLAAALALAAGRHPAPVLEVDTSRM